MFAEDDGSFVTRDELKALYEAVAAQKERLAEQERQLDEQKRRLEAQARELTILKATRQAVAGEQGPVQASFTAPKVLPDSLARPAASTNNAGKQVAQSEEGAQNQGNGQDGQPQPPTQPVGEAPPTQEEVPAVAIAADVSVLTKVGQLSVEPQIEYANSTVNRFSFSGLEIVDTILIGLIEATQASRDTYTASLGLRYGLFHRFEIDGRLPYLYRDDRITNRIVSLNAERTEELDGNGIGDAEFGAHYQLNGGQDGWPFFVGNVKVKTDTGTGPFDITADSNGVLSELPTGSGFWAVQPSITVIYPTDPAVMFANVGYIYTIPKDIDTAFGSNIIGEVDPGDTIAISFGMGIALNDITSISFGYEHNFIGGTEQVINGFTAESDDLQVGSLLIGFSHRVLDNMNMNLNIAVGVTDDSPDIRLSLRTPISFQLF
ncbi:MAG: transporter [Alphaproteobacteria bacterium]